jgi:hypothetical protein
MNVRAPARRNLVLGALGLALCLCAPFAWVLTLDVPLLMHTGAAAWLCIAIGLALGVSAMRNDTRKLLRVFVAADLVLAGLLAWGAYGLAQLPRAGVARASERAPEFDLVDHNGKPVRLSDELARGPVLLVFFRGSW